jgi:hypothetical protein
MVGDQHVPVSAFEFDGIHLLMNVMLQAPTVSIVWGSALSLLHYEMLSLNSIHTENDFNAQRMTVMEFYDRNLYS